ncbi:MAG: Na+/H+ antiporter subunit E [Thermoplasmata archaeon]|nr:Na+/H+ antiporter subunit E [Thermoplasmata archaeon]
MSPSQSDASGYGASPALVGTLSFIIWLGLTYSPGVSLRAYLQEAAIGLIISIGIGIISVRYMRVEEPSKRMGAKGVVHLFAYFLTLVVAIIKANLQMARIVISPRLPIRPGIVRIKTSLKSSTGKLFLSNSITLTPGTLTLNVMGDEMYIHWVYVKEGTREERGKEIKGAFERHLKEVFG